jgi:hypothetical protein
MGRRPNIDDLIDMDAGLFTSDDVRAYSNVRGLSAASD